MPQGIKGMSESDPIYSYIYLLMNILTELQVEKCKQILFYACFPQFVWTFWVARGPRHISVGVLETDVEDFKRKKNSGKKKTKKYGEKGFWDDYVDLKIGYLNWMNRTDGA